jgi:hypothetical protein
MPSKRTFVKRLAALATSGLAAKPSIDELTVEPPPDSTLLAAPEATNEVLGVTDPSSAIATGDYDPAAVASRDVDTVVTGRLDPRVLAVTGVPEGVGARLHQLLDRYDAVSSDRIRLVAGSVAFTDDGPEGCVVSVGDIDEAALTAELDVDPTVVRTDGGDSEFSRFSAANVGAAVAIAPGEIVAAYGPTASIATAHRNAGLGDDAGPDGDRRTGTTATYGSLPSVLGGDAVVCVDLGPDARSHLQGALSDAPDELRTAIDASGAVGASLRLAGNGNANNPQVAVRYGAVADPLRLDRETVETLVRTARDEESAITDAKVTRRGWTVLVDAAADGDLFASHASLIGASVGDPFGVTDA